MDQSCQKVFDELCRLVLELRPYGDRFSEVCEMSKGIPSHNNFHFEPSWAQGHESLLRKVGSHRFSHCTFAAALWLAAPHIPRFEGQTIGTWGRRAEGMTYVAFSSRHELLVPMFKNFLLLCGYVDCLCVRMGCSWGGDIVGPCKSLVHLRKALEERGLIMPEQPSFEAISPACTTANYAVSQDPSERRKTDPGGPEDAAVEKFYSKKNTLSCR